MLKIDIAFVILHYNTIKETNDLVLSIKNRIDTQNYRIVIVDNFSPNNSGEILQEQYKYDESVEVVLLQDNIGFARGNNKGIDFIRSRFDSDYICCMNNDTLLIQNNFTRLIKKEYLKSNAAVIGPLGYLKNNFLQKSRYRLDSIENYRKELETYKCIIEGKPHKSKFVRQMQEKHIILYKVLRRIKKNVKIISNQIIQLFRKTDVVLHGSCLIFTRSFFEKLSGFNPNTFLYREEELLYISLKKNNLLSVYTPNIKIKHFEDAATNSLNKTKDELKEVKLRNQINSLSVLIDEMTKMNNK